MTETLSGMSSMPKAAMKTRSVEQVERAAVRELVKAARARGDDLTSPQGLLGVITKQVLETALETAYYAQTRDQHTAELSHH